MQLFASSTTPTIYKEIQAKLLKLLPAMVDAGAMVVFSFFPQYIVIKPLTIWDSTEAEARKVLKPFADYLVSLGITPPIAYSELSYRDHYAKYLGPLPGGAFEVNRYQFGGRLIPRSVVENNTAELASVLSELVEAGAILAGSSGNYAKRANTPDNAVLPAWRGAITQLQLITGWNSTAPWAEMEAGQAKITNELMPKIEAVTPGSGAYMNEADFQQPNWQSTFYGTNYNKLKQIKKKYDPKDMFYNIKSVGSEAWTVAKDGRMCRA